jgi:excisionase family DNA binding protein
MTTADAARIADRTPRAITKAIAEGRLKAAKPGDVWLIARENLAHYLAARAA